MVSQVRKLFDTFQARKYYKTMVLIAGKDIPNLGFQLRRYQDTSKCREHSINLLEGIGDAVQVMECDILLGNSGKKTENSLQCSKYSKHSINLLSSEVGLAGCQLSLPTKKKSTTNMDLTWISSEDSKHSRNSQKADMTLTVIQTCQRVCKQYIVLKHMFLCNGRITSWNCVILHRMISDKVPY